MPSGQFLIASLENGFAPLDPDEPSTGGIIVLGGAQLPLISALRDQVSLDRFHPILDYFWIIRGFLIEVFDFEPRL